VIELTLTTPALLFPAISLLLLAYTNRFLTLASLIRELHRSYKNNPEEIIMAQLSNLRYRMKLIRDMQIFGVSSFFGCVLCMLLLFAGQAIWGKYIFAISLILLMVSLAISLREVQISIDALNHRLSDLEKK
jgi:hypothetical protein